GKPISSQPLPAGKPASSKWSPDPACARPSIGTDLVAPLASEISDTKVSKLTPVAPSAFATDSVDGQRARPSAVMRFDLLKVVGSRPDLFASPDGDKSERSASRSRAVQIWLWVSGALGISASDLRLLSSLRNYSLDKPMSSPTP